jgi:RNA polymerase sigma-70 factor (ECF subfamily)
VQKAINSLTREYKEAILLKCIEWYSYEEISDILKIPVGTASTLVNRARKQLKETLEKLKCNS